MRVVVAGGSAAGLFGALLLARAGHDVTVLDRDPVEAAPDVDAAAAAAFRAAAPQIVQPHAILPLCRELLRQHLPDVYDALLAAGVVEAPLPTQMPPTLPDRSARPGDERITMLQSRRSTVDWVLRRAAASEPRVTTRTCMQVTGLLADAGRPPHVRGVTTHDGDIAADLVVDATGRRSAIDRWLAAIGAAPTQLAQAECGLAYYSRHYRLRGTTGLPGPKTTRIVANLDEFTVGIWAADNDTMQMALAPLVEDKRFRAVADPAVHAGVLRSVPTYAAWLDVLEPITDVFPMAGLHNTLRRLVVDGVPVATGLVAIGDTVCTTNPTLGRGLSLALHGAADLVAVLDRHGDDANAVSLGVDALVDEHIEPFYRDQAAIDGARLAALRHTIFGIPTPRPPQPPDRVTFAQLRNAMPHDPVVFRAFWTVMGMLGRPDDVYADPEVVARTHEVLAAHGDIPPMTQPSANELRSALTPV